MSSTEPVGDGESRSASETPKRRRRLRLRASACLGAVLLILLFAVRGVGLEWAIGVAIERSPLAGVTWSVGSVEGNWLRRVRLEDVRLADSTFSVTARAVDVRYSLRAVLKRTVRVRSLRFDTPVIALTPASAGAGTEDSSDPFAALRPPPADSAGSGWTVSMDTIRIVDGVVERPTTDGEAATPLVSALQARAAATLGGAGLSMTVDTVTASVRPPGSTRAARVGMAGGLRDGLLTLRHLDLTSGRNHLTGSGVLAVPGPPPTFVLDTVDLSLDGRVVDWSDVPFGDEVLAVLADTTRPGEPIELVAALRVGGAADSVHLDADVSSSRRTHATVRATYRPGASPSAQNPPALRFTAVLDSLPPLPFAPSRFAGFLSGEASGSLGSVTGRSPYALEATLHHEPIEPGAAVLERAFRLGVEASGVGTRAAIASLDADLELSARADGATSWRPVATGSARVEDGVPGSWQLRVEDRAGSVVGDGAMTLSDTMWAVGVRSLRVSGLRPEGWLSTLPEAELNGRVQGRVESMVGGEPEGRLTVVTTPSSIGTTAIDSIHLDTRFHGREASGSLRAVAEPLGRGALAFRTRREPTGLVAHLDSLRFVRAVAADTAAPAASPTDPTLDLALSARADVFESGDSVRIVASLEPSRVYGVSVHGGSATVRSTPDRVDWETEVALGDSGRIDVRGSVTGLRETPRYAVDEGLLRNIPAELFRGAFVGTAPVSGGLRGEARGTTPESLRADAEVWLTQPISRDDGTVGADSLRLNVATGGTAEHRITAAVHPAEGGRLQLDGEATLTADTTRIVADAWAEIPEPARLLRGLTLDSAAIDVRACRCPEGAAFVVGEVTLLGARRSELRVDSIRTAFRIDSTGVGVDTLRVRSNAVDLDMGGFLPSARRSGTISGVLSVHRLDALGSAIGVELAGGGGRGDVVVTGRTDSLAVTVVGSLGSVASGSTALAGVDVDAELVARPGSGPRPDVRGRARIDVGRVSLPDTDVRAVTIRAAGSVDSVRIEAEADIDDARDAMTVMVLDPRPERRSIRIDDFSLSLDTDRWRLAEPARVSYLDGFSVDTLTISAGEQRIRMAGGMAGDGALDFRATMDSTDIGTVTDLAGFRGLEGWVSADLSLSGTRTVPRGHVRLLGGFRRDDGVPGDARVDVDLEGRRAIMDVELSHPDGGRLTVQGAAPLTTGTSGYDADVVADGFPLRWLGAFVDPTTVAGLSGTLAGSVRVTGTRDDPNAQGSFSLRDATLGLPALGVTWEGRAVEGRVDGHALSLDGVRVASSGGGEVRIDGTVTLTPELPLDLALRLEAFRVIRNAQYQAVVSGEMDVTGEAFAPTVEGDIRIESLDVFLDERVTTDGLEDVELTEEDFDMLRERFGYIPESDDPDPEIVDAMTADLSIQVGRDSWLRKRASPEMAVPFAGNLTLRMRPGEEIDVDGTLDIIPERGFVSQFGRRFALGEGEVRFSGPPAAATLDLTATYTVPSHDNPANAEVTIRLDIEGTQEQLDLSLSSEPQMDNADVVSYIATGRPASGGLSFSGGDSESGLVSTGTGLALGQLVGIVENAAQTSGGLDVVEIRREGLREATLVAGKYVSPRLYVGFAQPFSLREGDGLSLGGEGESEAEIELEALRWLLFNLEVSGSDIRLFLRGRHSY